MRLISLVTAAFAAFLFTAAPAQVNQGDLLRISNYLNGLGSMEGNFVQIGPDGELSQGRFYLRRPGRLRFEYLPPNPALIIADGTWVGVCDRQIETFDRFPLQETPLDLLLRNRVDLRKEEAVREITRAAGQMRVTAIDPDAPEQGSLTLVFSDTPLALKQWIVEDAQGLQTTVALSETRSNVSLSAELFFIDDVECTAEF